jgi:hypothetical protein
MRKREVEKLLYRTVAEALGVEIDGEAKKDETKLSAPAEQKPAHRDDDRAAA